MRIVAGSDRLLYVCPGSKHYGIAGSRVDLRMLATVPHLDRSRIWVRDKTVQTNGNFKATESLLGIAPSRLFEA